jgi:hypothetical protein
MIVSRDIAPLFKAALERDEKAQCMLEIVRQNTNGLLWIIGGYVFRTCASGLYGIERPPCDLDVIVSSIASSPPGWEVQQNRFGTTKWVSAAGSIDVVPLYQVHYIASSHIQPTMVHYLQGTPLTVQSIVYDMYNGGLYGESINALLRREVAVHNRFTFPYAAKMKGKSPAGYLEEMAQSLGFRSRLPPGLSSESSPKAL